MTEIEQIPENFDVNSLSEPSPETLSQFDTTCFQLDDLGIIRSPDPEPETGETPDFYTVQLSRQKFDNGTTISSFSFHGSDELAAQWSQASSTHTISLKTIDGAAYEYSTEPNGDIKLFIKKPGERVHREIDTAGSLTSDLGAEVSVSLSATPELMKGILATQAERREARALGLDRPTDASLKEFNAVIQEALTSGATLEE